MSSSEDYLTAPDDDENGYPATKAASGNIVDSLGADTQFIDDLISAVRLKNFLVGRGVEVLPEVLKGIATLVTAFQADIEDVRRGTLKNAPADSSRGGSLAPTD
ncbi:hypothetical protein [Neorhizobium galegae]|uniref:hypothetical protein n=1 Tax=Neorhizobium galegae TaxID=399 RepID=UPI001281ACAB|nr:hypothetical protein [Neorhizobium galegae]KAA9388307.1 hypothetical protein F4V88_18515 [Neorhizobium galegae]KAB1109858.1 hypothetical protein F4V89_25675 [Neorhizobium galegae]MCM2501293.1 hypothetical protein [Neorhizobium galegae]MCQ1770037.1 hypothetical protein [Neorhizobium galegae]MCQ1800342.1 hypothetical protein [Neorhizobium galegae]